MAPSSETGDVQALRDELRAAEAELELKDQELRSCNPRGPQSCEDCEALQEELASLQKDILTIEGNLRAGMTAEERTSSREGWRQRVAMLEEELRQTSEAVKRLRQRELWFELQLRRQREVHGEPLDALLAEVTDLQKMLLASRTGMAVPSVKPLPGMVLQKAIPQQATPAPPASDRTAPPGSSISVSSARLPAPQIRYS